ncbi:MAG: hypothetical protein NTX84_08310 [Nitrospirae bacterium]|nr:hypothetical protein [Nitrospirota bacterium]
MPVPKRQQGQAVVSAPRSNPVWWGPGVAIFGLGVVAWVYHTSIQADEWWVVGGFSIASGLMLLPAMWRTLCKGVADVLGDHLLVLSCAFIAYYVIGALLIPFGSEEEVEVAQSYYRIDAVLALRVTAVNCIGFGLALVSGSLIGRQWVSGLAQKAIGLGQFIPQEWIIAGFLLAGGMSSFNVLMFDLDPHPGEVVSGLFRMLSRLLLVAITVAAAHRGRGSVWLLSLAIVLTGLQAVGGLLLLNKSSVLQPMVALLVGLAWRLGVRRVMVPGVAGLLAVYLLIGNPVNTARDMQVLGDQVDWHERTTFLSDSFFLSSHAATESKYYPWVRFCYLIPQGAALNFYDMDQGGEDYRLLGWVFLPRVLFSDKPVMTASGPGFHYKVTGMDTSSTGIGVFVDGYYNLGWWGVVAVGVAVGCMLAWTSAFAVEVYRARALLWMPLALLGSFMAFRIDGGFLPDYCGTFVLACCLVCVGVVLSPRLSQRGRAG